MSCSSVSAVENCVANASCKFSSFSGPTTKSGETENTPCAKTRPREGGRDFSDLVLHLQKEGEMEERRSTNEGIFKTFEEVKSCGGQST